MGIRVHWSERAGPPRTELFPVDEITIGRVAGNHVVLPAGNLGKRHARVFVQDGNLVLVNIQAPNGTWLSGGRHITRQSVVLQPGDRVYIGEFVLTLSVEG